MFFFFLRRRGYSGVPLNLCFSQNCTHCLTTVPELHSFNIGRIKMISEYRAKVKPWEVSHLHKKREEMHLPSLSDNPLEMKTFTSNWNFLHSFLYKCTKASTHQDESPRRHINFPSLETFTEDKYQTVSEGWHEVLTTP